MENNLDSKEALAKHKEIIDNNKFLNLIHKNFYKRISSNISKRPIVELGSGPGFIKKVIHDITTTDVIGGPGIDRIVNAEKLPFKNNSIGSIVMLNVFHHIKNPINALREFDRCLKSNGKIIMVEPWPTMWSKFVYQNFHNEEFNVKGNWKVKGSGRMSDANGALPWIVFKRDTKKLKRIFPHLQITSIELHTPFKYLVSGNLSKPQLLPVSFYPIVDYFEKLISPLNRFLALFATIVITKVSNRTKHD